MDDHAARERAAEVEEALGELESLPPRARSTAIDALADLVDLYGEAWARTLRRLEDLRPGAASALAADELVGHLLMIHGLHPDGIEERVRGALDGLGAELVRLEGATAHVRVTVAAPAPAGDPELGFSELVRQSLLEAAPELEAIEVSTPRAASGNGPALVQLRRSSGPAAARGEA